jgi:hypothetical protein
MYYKYDIVESHCSQDVDVGLLGCNGVWAFMQVPTL